MTRLRAGNRLPKRTRWLLMIIGTLCVVTIVSRGHADDQSVPAGSDTNRTDRYAASELEGSSVWPELADDGVPSASWLEPDRAVAQGRWLATMAALGIVPAMILMTTAYVRIAVVLSLLRQSFGNPGMLPAQVTTALAMFCTGFVMWPTWTAIHDRSVQPLLAGDETNWEVLWKEGVQPVREFMIQQIKLQGNVDDVHLFLKHAAHETDYPSSYRDVPLRVLMPAFLLSELKTAFLIGFQIYLPFLVIDLVVASLTTSMGMFMVPPHTVALPLKLLLFVSVDGWRLVIDMVLMSFQ